MTPEEHKEEHIRLHRALDSLMIDFRMHHPNRHGFMSVTFQELVEWSHQQTVNPCDATNHNKECAAIITEPKQDQE